MTEKRYKEVDVLDNVIYINENIIGYQQLCDLLNGYDKENEQLRLQLNLCSDQRNEFHRGARENVNRVGKLKKENEQLKQTLRMVEKRADKVYEDNEQLKNHIQELQNHLKRLENENIQNYTLIKEAYNNERTELGKSVLKQLMEAIQ